MKMPSLKALHSHRSSTPSQLFVADSRSAVWTRSNTDDVSLSQLHKFWTGLSSTARRELLRIDKQALFEQVRKNLYCSRCHGLLVEGYAQIVSYGKNLQAGLLGYGNGSGACGKHLSEVGTMNGANTSLQDDTRDPSVHPWGGLAATRDSMLTVLDCFLDGTPLEVFESARARERERELLYPDACGGGGRGWISQSSGSFGGNGRGHGMKETCALHTARLSCEALVDFWSALGEETRRSLLRMKEEDFIERLMFRFDSKRFCRDCRRNVLREFKEMKELKRTRKEPRCTQWFCAADTAFRYEVSDTKVHVDWRDSFSGDGGSLYQRFDWGLGTAEGKTDILNFQDVGLSESIRVEGLDLGNTAVCFIMVRGWKRDGRCTELTAKAHALKGQLCVHRRLIVGDGYVSITKGESIQHFFERAEETEEEEDDDTMDKDGNEIDGEGSRPQRHAKSPELARDFLLDAATVIFKEQVEKAFREGTARQNAHSIFVCLALSLLEERVRVACKEISTLEKQNKLLEEEEDEKREEEERRERRKLKEKEKKLRRKEKLKEKEREKEKCKSSAKTTLNGSVSGKSFDSDDVERGVADQEEIDSRSDIDSISARPPSPDMAEARPSVDGAVIENGASLCLESSSPDDIEVSLSMRDGNGAFLVERTKSSKRRVQGRQPQISEGDFNGQSRGENVDPEGSEPSFARLVQPSIVVKAQPLQVRSKKCGQDTDSLSKRTDPWHRSAGQAQHKLDEILNCACGGPQTNPRVKGGHRNLTRVSTKDPLCKLAEKVEHGMKGVSKNLCVDFVNPHDKLDGVKGKVSLLTTAKRKGERDHENVILGDMAKQCLSRSASAGNLNEGIRKNVVALANSDVGAGKTLGITASPNTTAGEGCGSFGDPVSSHGICKGVSTRATPRPKPTGGAYVGKLTVPENDVRPVTQVIDEISGPHESHGASSSLLVGGTVCTNGTNVTSHPVQVGSDPPNQIAMSSTGDFVAKKAIDQAVNSNEHAKLVSKVVDADRRLVSDEGTCNLSSMVGDNSVPSRVLGSQGPVLGASQNSRLTVAKDVVAVKPSIRAVQLPTLIPQPPLHVHPSASFGYYQGPGSWGATRSRSAVLSLPPAGGFLIPGPTTLSTPIGCLAPVALSQEVAPVVEAGCRSTMPNGGNTLQLRESVYLPRFSGGPGGEVEGKQCASHNPVSAMTVGDETVSVIRSMDGQSTPVEVEAASSASSSTLQKDHGSDSAQLDTNVFSLFHFSGPAAVAQKEVDSSAVGPSPKESSSDKIIDSPAEAGMSSNTVEGTGGAVNSSSTAGEYSLFAKAGTGLVFFQGQ